MVKGMPVDDNGSTGKRLRMLEGKTAVVTGAAKGIGKAIALAFAKEGCNIVLNYHSNLSEETIQEIEACNVKCLPVQGDVSDFKFAGDFIKQAKKEFGSVDILVNNAGITRDMLLMRMSEEGFDSVINTNLGMPDRQIMRHQRQASLALQSQRQRNWRQEELPVMRLLRAL